jgi:hypothetical protein
MNDATTEQQPEQQQPVTKTILENPETGMHESVPIDHEWAMHPETLQWVLVPSDDPIAVAARAVSATAPAKTSQTVAEASTPADGQANRSKSAAKPRRSHFEDEDGEDVYATTVRIDDLEVHIVLLNRAQCEAYSQEEQIIKRAYLAVSTVNEDKQEALLAQLGERQIKLFESAILPAARGWSADRPCDEANIKKLWKTDKRELAIAIYQKSVHAIAQLDFLGSSSSS